MTARARGNGNISNNVDNYQIVITRLNTEPIHHRGISRTSHLATRTSRQFTIRIPEMSSGLIASNPIAGHWAMMTSIRMPCVDRRSSCDLKSRELTIIHHPRAPAVVWNANSADLVLGPSPAHKKFEDSVTSLTIYCARLHHQSAPNPLVWGHFPVKLSRWGPDYNKSQNHANC